MLKARGLLDSTSMKHDANGRSQHSTAHALLNSHAHRADVVSRNMMHMAYDRSWQAQVATAVAPLLCSRRLQHANHVMNNDNNANANTRKFIM